MFLSTHALDGFEKFSESKQATKILEKPKLPKALAKKVHYGVECNGNCKGSYIERTRFVCLTCLDMGHEMNFCFQCAAMTKCHDRSHPLLSVPSPLDGFDELLASFKVNVLASKGVRYYSMTLCERKDFSCAIGFLIKKFPDALTKNDAYLSLLRKMHDTYKANSRFRLEIDQNGSGFRINELRD